MSMCCWELFWSPLEFITRNSHLWRYSGRMHSPWALYMYDSDFMFLSITWHDYCYSFCGANGKLSRHFIRLWAGQRIGPALDSRLGGACVNHTSFLYSPPTFGYQWGCMPPPSFLNYIPPSSPLHHVFSICSHICLCVLWLDWVLVLTREIFDLHCSMWTLSCGMWDLVPQPVSTPRPPALGLQP